MSIRIMTAAWDIALPDSEKLVLLALADCANDEGVCWPSMATLVRKCSKSDRTIQAAVKSLVEKGQMSRLERRGKGVLYTIHPGARPAPSPEATSPPDPRSGFTPETASPPKPFPPTPEAASDKPSRTTIPKDADASSGERGRAATPASKPKPKPKKRAIFLPENWQPEVLPDDSIAAATVARWEPGWIERELSRFRDHWRAASGEAARKRDWQAAWRTWIGRADDFGTKRAAGNGPHGAGDRHNRPGRFRDPLLNTIARDGHSALD